MSDTSKATPRPWHHGNAHFNPDKGEEIFIGFDGSLVASTGDIGGFLKEVDADLVLAAINSYNPKRDKLARELADLIIDEHELHRSLAYEGLSDSEPVTIEKARQLLKLYAEEETT